MREGKSFNLGTMNDKICELVQAHKIGQVLLI